MRIASRSAAVAALAIAALASASACSRKKDAGKPSPLPADAVAAEVEGEAITMAELDHRLVEKMPADRVFEMRKQVLDELVMERLLAREAKKRGLSPEALAKAEIEDKAKPVLPGEAKELFDRAGLAARGATLEQYQGRIEQSLRDQRRAERRTAFAEELRAQTKVKLNLQEPREQLTFPADAPMLGPPGAPVTLVEFLDYQCTYCQRVQGVVEQVIRQFPGKVRFVHRDFPLDNLHPQAMGAARAARCAGDQGKFWEYHRKLLSEPGHDPPDLRNRAIALGLDEGRFTQCLASTRHDAAIEQAAAQGRELGVSGTPTFFINGRRLVGIRSAEDFAKVIEEELKRVG
jgi:protein-disulfide isomerase